MTTPVLRRAGVLSSEALVQIRSLLICEIAEQAEQLADSRLTSQQLSGLSDVDSIVQRDAADASAVRSENALAEAQAALARLDAGHFGMCEGCGDAIDPARLEAVPHARRCVACPEFGGSALIA